MFAFAFAFAFGIEEEEEEAYVRVLEKVLLIRPEVTREKEEEVTPVSVPKRRAIRKEGGALMVCVWFSGVLIDLF